MDAKTIDNFDSEFTCNQKVILTTGFYKGYKGTIESYDAKNFKYIVKISINDRPSLIVCKADQLKGYKTFF